MELEIYSPTKDGFVKLITWNHEQIKKEVAEKVKKYSAVVYTDDQIQDAKADLAKLRKFVDVLETKRKEIKKQCLAPYEAFEKQMNEITAIVNEPILMIDKQVKEYEEIKRAEKRDAIESYWISLSEDGKIPVDITLDRIFNEKWLNASVTLKTVCTEINARIEQIEKDLATLAELPEFAFEAKEVYKHTLDLNQAIGEGKRLAEIQKRKAEAEAAMQNAAKAAECMAKAAVNATVMVQQFADAAEPEKHWISFRAFLSTEDALALKDFFTARNIQFEAIKQINIKEKKTW